MRKYWVIFCFHLKAKLNFKVDFIFSLFSFTIHIFIFNELWDFILQDKQVLDYSRKELIWYIIMGECILYILNRKICSQISDMIKNGDVANLLSKPVYFLQYTIAEQSTCIINLIVNIISSIILGILMAGVIPVSVLQIIFVGISMILSVILFLFVLILIGFLAFFTEENHAYYLVISKAMLLLVLTPLEFFPKVVQFFFKILPTTYIVYPPSKILVHFQLKEACYLIGLQLLFCLLMLFINIILNEKGVKKINVNGG